jgi:hypothetical protein
MVKVVYCMRRKPELSREEFQRYCTEGHGPLLRSLAPVLGIRRVVRVHTVDDGLNAAMRAWIPGPEPYDGLLELWVDSIDGFMSRVTSEEGRKAADTLIEDSQRFIDLTASPIWVAKEEVLVEGVVVGI